MTKSFLHCASVFVLMLASTGASHADDVIIDGKHCNSFCQSWLGVAAMPPHVATAAVGRMEPVQAPQSERPAAPGSDAPPVRAPRYVVPTPQLATQEEPTPQLALQEEPSAELRDQAEIADPVAAPRRFSPPSIRRRVANTAPQDVTSGRIFATLPRSSELVAVPGEIIVESAESRALKQRQLAEMLSATSKPKKVIPDPLMSEQDPTKASVPEREVSP